MGLLGGKLGFWKRERGGGLHVRILGGSPNVHCCEGRGGGFLAIFITSKGFKTRKRDGRPTRNGGREKVLNGQ